MTAGNSQQNYCPEKYGERFCKNNVDKMASGAQALCKMSTTAKKIRANTWVQFTKRTDDPKLTWLQLRLLEIGIESRRRGCSWHGPILEVRQRDLARAWEILTPIDNMRDDAPHFHTPAVMAALAHEKERS